MKSAVVSRIFICLLAMAPLLGIFAALGEATLLAVAALLAIAAAPRACWTLIRREKILVGLLIALAAWAAASAVWSILPLHSFIEGVRFLTLSATGLFVVAAAGALAPEDRQRLVRWVAIGMIAAVAVFAADWLSGWPLLRRLSGLPADSMVRLERFDRGTTVLGLLLWPIAFHLKRRGQTLLLIGVVAAVALAFAIIPSSTNRLALIVGIAVCAVAWLRPRLMAAGIVAIMVLVTFALPTAITKLLPTNESIVQLHDDVPGIKFTALHRLLIWRFVADRVAERPWLGWGMDASRGLPGGHDKLADTLSQPIVPPDSEALPLHPHNGQLQWWVELGAIGAALCLAVVAMLGNRAVAAARSRFEATAMLACLATALVISFAAYGFWQAWWLSTLWLAASMFAVSPGEEAQTTRS